MPIKREVQIYCSTTKDKLEVYPSAAAAAEAYGTTRALVSARCRGDIRQGPEYGHYVFKYTGRITPKAANGC